MLKQEKAMEKDVSIIVVNRTKRTKREGLDNLPEALARLKRHRRCPFSVSVSFNGVAF
jgi:hypothetical protein